jgi:mRNA interferase HigB
MISNKTLVEFSAKHPDAAQPLQAWRKMLEGNKFINFATLKAAFNATDKVGEYHVFDIGGNKYRVIAFIKYQAQICYIKHVFTHKEYEKGNWK